MVCMRSVVAVMAIAGTVLASGAAHAQETDVSSSEGRAPITAARFAIVIDGHEIASFTRFDSMVDPSTSVPSQAILLTGGHTYSPEINAWHEAALMGRMDVARRTCSIVMYDYKGTPVATWRIINAWPSKYTGVSTKNGRGLATEGVILVYERIEVSPER